MNAARKIETLSAILPRAEVRAALAVAKKVVERRNSIPVLSNVLLQANADGAVEMLATDLDIEVAIRINGASADENFGVTLPAHTFQDIEKKARATEALAIDAPDVPEVPAVLGEQDESERAAHKEAKAAADAATNQAATLDFEGLRVSMQHISRHDFPRLEWSGATHAEFDFPAADLLEMIQKTEFAISTEETRYYLNGIYLHAVQGFDGFTYLASVATDGHRLAKCIRLCGAAKGMPGVIVPRKTVALLRDLLKAKGAPESVRIKINTTKALFTIGNVAVMTKLVDGTFPDYNRVIPSGNEKRARFDRDAMSEAIASVTCISSERGRAVRLAFSDDARGVRLSVINPDVGTANLYCPVEYDYLPLEVGFNAVYMRDILAKCGDDVTLHLSDSGSPARITSSGDSGTEFVLMPMRV